MSVSGEGASLRSAWAWLLLLWEKPLFAFNFWSFAFISGFCTILHLLVEEIRGKIRELGIKPAFLRRLGPSVTKEELESVYQKIESLTRIFEEMSLFFVFSRKNETSRPPPAPTSDNYDKTPLANGPTYHPDNTLVPPPRSLRPARIPARNPRARRHHTRGVGGGKRDGASGGANGGANDEASGGGRAA